MSSLSNVTVNVKMLEIYHNLLRAARRRWGKKLMGEVSMEFRETFRAFKSFSTSEKVAKKP
jgi:hypothetical protein